MLILDSGRVVFVFGLTRARRLLMVGAAVSGMAISNLAEMQALGFPQIWACDAVSCKSRSKQALHRCCDYHSELDMVRHGSTHTRNSEIDAFEVYQPNAHAVPFVLRCSIIPHDPWYHSNATSAYSVVCRSDLVYFFPDFLMPWPPLLMGPFPPAFLAISSRAFLSNAGLSSEHSPDLGACDTYQPAALPCMRSRPRQAPCSPSLASCCGSAWCRLL